MSTALKQMTADEFLLWAEGREGRWELHDGVPVMMAPERAAHVRTKGEVLSALEDAVGRAGLPCEVFAGRRRRRGSTRGRSSSPTRRLSAARGRRPTRSSSTTPIIVVEVLSPSTAAIDHGPQAQRLFLAAERRALSHSRPRAPRRDPSQARAGRGDRDARVVERRREARSAGVRGRGRGAVSAGLEIEPEQRPRACITSAAQGEAIEARVLSGHAAKLDPPGFEVAVEALFPPSTS